MTDEASNTTSILHRLRFALLSGELLAGQKLKPDHLKKDYGVSASSVREALLRLVGEGLVEVEDQRGFSVPKGSVTRMTELQQLRALVECEGARASIERGGLEWEARLNASHYKLSHIEQRLKDSASPQELLPLWTRADNEFHETLVSNCGSTTLMALRTSLFHRARQQIVACDPSFGFRDETVREHDAILQAALSQDAEACEAAIRIHLRNFQHSLNTEHMDTASSGS